MQESFHVKLIKRIGKSLTGNTVNNYHIKLFLVSGGTYINI